MICFGENRFLNLLCSNKNFSVTSNVLVTTTVRPYGSYASYCFVNKHRLIVCYGFKEKLELDSVPCMPL